MHHYAYPSSKCSLQEKNKDEKTVGIEKKRNKNTVTCTEGQKIQPITPILKEAVTYLLFLCVLTRPISR